LVDLRQVIQTPGHHRHLGYLVAIAPEGTELIREIVGNPRKSWKDRMIRVPKVRAASSRLGTSRSSSRST
jgi:hypothetical protein